MKNANNWSKWRQDITIKFLRNRNKVANLPLPTRRCDLINIDGRCGLIYAKDILANKWIINVYKWTINIQTSAYEHTGWEKLIFESLTDLVKAGWVVSLKTKRMIRERICKGQIKTAEQALEAVKETDGKALELVPRKLMTEEICIEAVKNWGNAVEYVPKKFMTDEMRLVKAKLEEERAIKAAKGKEKWQELEELELENSCQSDSEPCLENWSDSLQDRTINTLSDMDCVALWHSLPNKSGVLKNCNGSYGFMKAEDAIAQKWIITLENGETVNFASITDLLKAGWVVD